MSKILSNINESDRIITLAVAKWRRPAITFILKLFTYSARGYAWAIYIIFLLIQNNMGVQTVAEQASILRAMIFVFMTWVIGNIFKKIFKRKRPFQAIGNFKALVSSPIDDSFPSLHAGSTTAFFVALLLFHHPWAIWGGVWALIVIFSRLYLGVHYLSDLLGGMFLGIFCVGLNFII